jgi:hypothetical protein
MYGSSYQTQQLSISLKARTEVPPDIHILQQALYVIQDHEYPLRAQVKEQEAETLL